ncbi:hypothetical protein F0562_002487 [Nyssa sinensis]|uniref:Uncharacterized protein n=1 Tax=Nyssa sinensis TaxID=561372 RepID=A0A5J5C604_9ASTE|nr:hypothetical protein F0562_002487 [Nyssa sinensis]
MERLQVTYKTDLNLRATELRLGLPGSDEPERQPSPSVRSNKRASSEMDDVSDSKNGGHQDHAPPTKAQVVGVATSPILPEKLFPTEEIRY